MELQPNPIDEALAVIRAALVERAPGMTLTADADERGTAIRLRLAFSGEAVADVPAEEVDAAGAIALARHVDTLMHGIQGRAFEDLGLYARLRAVEDDARRRIGEARIAVVDEVRSKLAARGVNLIAVQHALDETAAGR